MAMGDTALIGIDWGLSRIRAYQIGGKGQLLESRSHGSGLAAVRDGDFDAVLQTVIGDWRGGPILMCGMIGSRQGWKEAPYASCPLGLLEIAAAPLDCGNSGSTMRMLSGILVGQPFTTELFGDESLSADPWRASSSRYPRWERASLIRRRPPPQDPRR